MLKSLLQKIGLSKPPVDYTYTPDENHIEILNFWTLQQNKELWFYQYLLHHFSKQLGPQNSLLLSSVFGPKNRIGASKSRIKLFYTGENVVNFPEYTDHCKRLVDLALGFDHLVSEDYQRFPLWILYSFDATADEQEIRRRLDHYTEENICPDDQKKFASLICRHDKNGLRTILFDALSQVDRVDSAGAYLRNTNDLQEKFQDNKIRFNGHYKFSICPENTNREGYVTEKVFEAIRSNTIPIYWGSNNNPEPDVLNKNAILFYEGPESLPALQKQITALHTDPGLYHEFMQQPRFQPHAAEYVAELFNGFHAKLQKLLQ